MRGGIVAELADPNADGKLRGYLHASYADLRELFSSTLPDDRKADGRSVWEIWTPVCDALLEGRAIEISRYELPDWHLESPKHGGNPHDRFVLDADDVLRPAPELPKVTPNRATRRAIGQRGPGLNGQR